MWRGQELERVSWAPVMAGLCCPSAGWPGPQCLAVELVDGSPGWEGEETTPGLEGLALTTVLTLYPSVAPKPTL